MKRKLFGIVGALVFLLTLGLVLAGCDNGSTDDPSDSNEPVIETFPEDSTSAEGTARCYAIVRGEYGCDFENKSSQKVYVKVGDTVKSIAPKDEASFESSTASFSFVYAPADQVQLGTNDLSIAGTVKFVNQSLTTGTIKITNSIKVNGYAYPFKRITITDVTGETPTVYKTDTTALHWPSSRTYTVPGGRNYKITVLWGFGGTLSANSGTTINIGAEYGGYIPLPNGGEASLSQKVSTTYPFYYFDYLLQ